MKKFYAFTCSLLLAGSLSAQTFTKSQPEKFLGVEKYSFSDVVSNSKGTVMIAPKTFDVTGTNLNCGDSLDVYYFKSSAGNFVFYYGTPYAIRVAQKLTAQEAGTIDSVLVLEAVYTKSGNAAAASTLRFFNVDATTKAPVASPSYISAARTVGYVDSTSTTMMKPVVYKFATPITVTAGQTFFMSLSTPTPQYGDTIGLWHMAETASCNTETDSTVWVYAMTSSTTAGWLNWTRQFIGINNPLEVAIIPYLTTAPTSVKQITASTVSIYPNPAKGVVNVDNLGKNVNVTMMNSLGQVVYNNVVSDNVKINTENMVEGVYFVRVNSSVTKVVVTK